MKANNVIRMLDQQHVLYKAFHIPAEKLGAVEASQYLGVAPKLVYKTIVVTRLERGKNILAVVPGDKVVDLKALANALGDKKLHLPTERDAERLTGLQAGGISPLALINRGFQVVIDASAKQLEGIYISGGVRGLNIRLSPIALAEMTKAIFAPITRT
jgi:Cys-tRNA(Pro)/Cys-tRNA(Cys) deacylase